MQIESVDLLATHTYRSSSFAWASLMFSITLSAHQSGYIK